MRIAVTVCLLAGAFGAAPAVAQAPVAIVPTKVIYPGQAIDPAFLQEVEVTNPNVRKDFVSSRAQLADAVARRTLLPGHVIPTAAIREDYKVEQGSSVRLVFSLNGLVITAAGKPLQSGNVGDFVRVRNVESGVTVAGTVLEDGSVQVVAQ